MEKTPDGLWDYAERWSAVFSRPRDVIWDKNWIKNDYCADCRYCCGPQDSDYPFPMPLLEKQDREGLEKDFHLLDRLTPYLGGAGCRSLKAGGCGLCRERKPIACGLFPIVLANGGLYLYQNCPSVLFTPLIRFLGLAREAANMLCELDLAELRRLSLWLTSEQLARSYINLRVRLFDESGKALLFE